MPVNIAKEVAALERMTVRELRLRYAEVFNEETKAGNKAWLIKRIAWRLQSLEEGDISERARQRAAELANDADVRLSPPKAKPKPMTTPDRTTTATLGDTSDDRARSFSFSYESPSGSDLGACRSSTSQAT